MKKVSDEEEVVSTRLAERNVRNEFMISVYFYIFLSPISANCNILDKAFSSEYFLRRCFSLQQFNISASPVPGVGVGVRR